MRGSVCKVLLILLAAGCQPNTSRPPFMPLPEAAGTEIRLSVRDATRYLAEGLRADSIPVSKVALRDGYLESPWFNARTGRPIRGSRAPGSRAVRVRAWADPARPGSSRLTVETSYRALLDPSLPQRELDRQVPPNHPVAVKVEALLRRLVERYGGAPALAAPPAPPPAGPPSDR
jgi:hypothetical protein